MAKVRSLFELIPSLFNFVHILTSHFSTVHFNTTLPSTSLGGVMVSVVATGPKGSGLEHGQGDGFLREIKIRSTSSFGWKVKPVSCRKILWHVTELFKSHGDE
jgi:hypothetical protein